MKMFSKFAFCCCAIFSCLFSSGNASVTELFSKEHLSNEIDQKKESEVKKVILYINPNCPYCKKVLHELEQMDKSVLIKDISEDKKLRDELIKIGGKKQVPCIVIDGIPKYESAEIIRWLENNKQNL